MEDGCLSRRSIVSKISISLSVVFLRLLLTVAVAATVVFIHPVGHFFAHTKSGLALYILTILTAFIVMWPYSICRCFSGAGVRYVLAVVFNLALAFAVGLTCSFSFGKILFESLILSAVAIGVVTLCTFWVVFKGYNFQPHLPSLIAVLITILFFALVQVYFPSGKISFTIIGLLMSILFCGCLVYGANFLIIYEDDNWSCLELESSLYAALMGTILAVITMCCGIGISMQMGGERKSTPQKNGQTTDQLEIISKKKGKSQAELDRANELGHYCHV